MGAVASSKTFASSMILAMAMAAIYGYAAVKIVVQSAPNRAIDAIKAEILEIVEGSKASQTDITVSIGRAGFEEALASASTDTVIIASFISSTDYEQVLKGSGTTLATTAIYNNPDPQAQVVLARSISASAQLSVVQSTVSKALTEAMDGAAINVIAQPDSTEQLIRKLAHSDLFIVLPDSSIVNSGNVRYIIRSLYRQRAALIGYSKKITEIGGLASVYPSRDAVFKALEAAMLEHEQTGQLPAPLFVNNVEVTINHRLASSLGFQGLDEETLEQMVELELGSSE